MNGPLTELYEQIDADATVNLFAIRCRTNAALRELRAMIAFANRSAGQKRRQWRARIVARDWQGNRGEKA